MKTNIFLWNINDAIAEAFAPLLNKKQEFRKVHEIVEAVVTPLLPESLEYRIWYLGPNTNKTSRAIILSNIKLFELKHEGFEQYKGTAGGVLRSVGKWIKPPYYEVLGAVAAPTLKEVIRRGLLQGYQSRIHDVEVDIAEIKKELSGKKQYLAELRKEEADV